MRTLRIRPVLPAALGLLLLFGPLAAAAGPSQGSEDVVVSTFSGSFSEPAWRIRPTGTCVSAACSDGAPWGQQEHHFVIRFGADVHTVVVELVYERDTPLSDISLKVWCEREDVPRADCTLSRLGEYQRIVIDIATSAGGRTEREWHFEIEAEPRPHVDAAAWAEVAIAFGESYDAYISMFSGSAAPGDHYTAVPA